MKESWFPNIPGDWSAASAWQALDDLRGQFKRNVDMRMNRGDVRTAILRLLSEAPMHGYQIISEIETRSQGAWKPSPGSVYPTLQLLTDEGLVTVEQSKSARRTYVLTDVGREIAEAEADAPAPWLTGSSRPSGPRAELGISGVKLAKAAADIARLGSNDDIAQATALIDELAKKLAQILAHN